VWEGGAVAKRRRRAARNSRHIARKPKYSPGAYQWVRRNPGSISWDLQRAGGWLIQRLFELDNKKPEVLCGKIIKLLRKHSNEGEILDVVADLLDPNPNGWLPWRLDFTRRHPGEYGQLSSSKLYDLGSEYEKRLRILTEQGNVSPAKVALGEMATKWP
jgi:hypothetical protein